MTSGNRRSKDRQPCYHAAQSKYKLQRIVPSNKVQFPQDVVLHMCLNSIRRKHSHPGNPNLNSKLPHVDTDIILTASSPASYSYASMLAG